MSLDDYSIDERERIFFDKASMAIFEWLSDEEKLKLNIELVSEGFLGIQELAVRDRFFRLLNFLEVKYVRVGKRIKYVFDCLKEINAVSRNDAKIEDIEIKNLRGESIKFSNAKEFLNGSLEISFAEALRNLELEKEYKRYLTKLEGVTHE